MIKKALLLLLTIVASTALAQEADLAVEKLAPSTAPGNNVAFTVTVTNLGPFDASNVTLSDPVPAGMSYVSRVQDTGPVFSCDATINCTIATLPVNQSASFTFTFHMDSGTDFVNTATATSPTPDPDGQNNASTAGFTLDADLAVEKIGPSEAPANSDVAYTVTVTNVGPADAPDVTLSDPVPAGMSYVSAVQNTGPTFSCDATITCTIATLPVGVSASFTFTFHMDSGTDFVNTATVSSETPDPNEENDSSSAFTSTGPPPQGDVFVQKDVVAGAAPDTDVTFFITVGNAGPSAAEDFQLTDNLPAPLTFVSFFQTSGPTMTCGVSTCTLASFPPFTTATFSLTGHIPAGTPGGTSITNTATLESSNDPSDENNSATATVVVSTADVRVTKTGPPTAVAGTTISYDVTVTNDGPDVALNVVVNDPPLCNQFNCDIGTLNPGQSVNFTFDVDIPAGATSFSNTATVSTDSFDPNTNNNTATVDTVISQSADVRIEKTGPGTVAASSNITYTVTVTNDGPSNASNVVVNETTPAGTTFVSSSCGSTTCNVGTLAAGASQVLTFVFNVDVNAVSPITNTVTVSSTTTDPDPGDNSAGTSTTVTAAPADVSITKTADFTTSTPGSNATYTITVRNNGPGVANDVTVTDTLPAGTTLVSASPGCTGTTTITCMAGTLANGAQAVFTIVITLPSTPGTVTNTASVTTSSTDSGGGNNSSTAVISTLPAALGIPTLSPLALAMMALMIATVVLVVLRRAS